MDRLVGQSGNPSGSPKKHLLSGCYEALIEQPLPEDLRVGLKLKKGATWGNAIVLGQARAAIKGKTEAAREIGDRLEGKARQPVEVSGRNGGPSIRPRSSPELGSGWQEADGRETSERKAEP